MIIHISTDYVFDGRSSRPYLPDDPAAPINVYGDTKLAGEKGVRDLAPRHAIVRTSWVYNHDGRNFVRTMLRLALEQSGLNVVYDQHGRPTSAQDLAHALLTVATVMKDDDSVNGTFHFANTGQTTWFDFAKTLFELRGLAPSLRPISTSEFPTAAKRPMWSVLDTSSFEQTFGITPRKWEAALVETLKQIQ